MHYPLSIHASAEKAARFAECAARQGKFWEMHDVLFARQRDLASVAPLQFAREAGVMNEAAFQTCADGSDELRPVSEGKRIGDSFGIDGTPTIIVNGWKIPMPPGVSRLEQMGQAILDGKKPV